MGIETAIAIGAGTQLLGSVLNYGEQRAARKRQQKAQDTGVQLTQGSNPVDQMILQQLSRPNTGQDGFLQMLRNNPNSLKPYMFNYSQAFQDLRANDRFNLQDQLAGLRTSAGSLGERFGSGFAAKEGMLRNRFAADISARNAGIAQNSFNTALQYGASGYALSQQMAQNQNAQLLGLLLNSQQGRTSQQLQALGLAGQPIQSNTGQQIAQGGSDIAQLLVLKNYFGGGGGGTIASGGGLMPSSTTYSQPFWG